MLLRAVASAVWDRPEDERRRDLLRVFDVDPSTLTPPARRARGFFETFRPDADYERAVRAVAEALLSAQEPDVAAQLAERLRAGLSGAVVASVSDLLHRAGFTRLIEGFAQWLRTTAGERPEPREREPLLELIAGLAPPAELDRPAARRLQELSDLVALAGVADAPAGEVDAGIETETVQLRLALTGAARRAGLDLGVVSAESRLLLDISEPEDDELWWPLTVLMDDEADVSLLPWDQVVELDDTIAALEAATAARSPWIAELAHHCLADRPGPAQDERA